MNGRARGRRLLAAGAAALLAASAVRAQVAVAVSAGAEGEYRLTGRFGVDARPELAWSVLTDYEGLSGFVSSIRASRVLSRDGEGALIEQEGTGRFLFISRRVRLRLAVRERAPSSLSFEDIDGGQFRVYRGSWTITPEGEGCVVDYELVARPEPSLAPDFAAARALRKSVQRLLGEVREEMGRRARGG